MLPKTASQPPMSDDAITPAETGRKVAAWERHGQTIMIGVVMLLIGWVGRTVLDGQSKNVETAGQIALLTQQLGSFKDSTARDIAEIKGLVQAMQGNYVAREDFRDHEARIRALEHKRTIHETR